ncbi:serine/threonine protein kinase [Gloeomargaritales cyanobacterium VI4D9]|nr:serine/threonine protein kinase [Gloeomargaritales cyanobacterium VI4D9]
MSYCLNPDCPRPGQNPPEALVCQACGSDLVLQNRYRPLRPLGQGGFGRTFLAVDEDKPSKPKCVVKQFLPMEMDAQSYAKASELFQREALRLDELGHHEQIPKLYAYFEQEQRQYIIQEFIDGNNLARELQLYGPYNEAKALQLLKDLVPVLEFVHDHHVIHRDVKPENVIRSGVNGKLYLVDFGAAKFAPSTSMSNLRTIISSAGFTAPEQMVGKAEFVSDLYSLGVTCVHLMTGRPPLELYDMSQDGWVWQDYVAEPVSPVLAQILNRLLERATRKRYQSAAEVRQDLEALSQGNRLGTPSRLQPSSAPTASKLVLNFPQRQKNTTASQVKAPTWECVCTLGPYSNWITAVASVEALGGGTLIAAAGKDGILRLWQLSGQEHLTVTTLWSYTYTAPVMALQFTPDGQSVVAGCEDRTLRLWEVGKGKITQTLGGMFAKHSSPICAIAVSPNGRLVASGSEDKTIRIWELSSGKCLCTLTGHSSHVRGLSFTPDGFLLVSGGWDNTLVIWEAGNGRSLRTIAEPFRFGDNGFNAVVVSPDSQWIATGNENRLIHLWDFNKGERVHSFPEQKTAVSALAFAPRGNILVSGNQDGLIQTWDMVLRQQRDTLKGHSKQVTSLAFTPDGNFLISGSRDNSIRIWRHP